MTAGPAAGTRIGLGSEPLTIGRAQDGPGALGGDAELSREHARLRRLADGRLMVEDLGSTNGTFVNGTPIPAPTMIGPGDEVSLGASTLRVARGGGRAPAPPPREKRPALRVVAGWAPGAHIPVAAGGTTVGRAAAGANAFEGDEAVAAEHARVSLAGDAGVVVEDLGSEAGTLVAGAPIHAPTLVRVGDRLQLGGSTLEVVLAAVPAGEAPAGPPLALGGVREVPEGLFQRLAMRAPVTRQEVVAVMLVAIGWALALNLLLRSLALDVLDVKSDLSSLKVISVVLASVLPIVFNSLGFFNLFRRPDDTSVKRYVVPTVIVPLLFVVINLARINDHGAGEVAFTVIVTVLPVVICAPLMLRLRDRVARRRVAQVRSA